MYNSSQSYKIWYLSLFRRYEWAKFSHNPVRKYASLELRVRVSESADYRGLELASYHQI